MIQSTKKMLQDDKSVSYVPTGQALSLFHFIPFKVLLSNVQVHAMVKRFKSQSHGGHNFTMDFGYHLQWRMQDFSQEGAPTPIILSTFCQKLHENERI